MVQHMLSKHEVRGPILGTMKIKLGFSKTGVRDGTEFQYVGQTHSTFGILLLELEMVTSEIQFVLKDEPRIKMRMDPV